MTENKFKKTFNKNNLRIFALSTTLILFIISVYGLIISLQDNQESLTLPTKINYQHQGEVDYTVHLRPNSLYTTDALEPQAVFFTPLIDAFTIHYKYAFFTEDPDTRPSFIYQVDGLFGVEGVWQRDLQLLPPAQIDSENFEISFAVPLSDLLNDFDIFARETGSTLNEPALDIIFNVTPDFEIAKGKKPQAFTQHFVININQKTIRPNEILTQEETSSVVINTNGPDSNTNEKNTTQWLSIAGITVTLLSLIYLGRNEINTFISKIKDWSPRSSDEKDFRFAKKRLGGLFVETDKITPAREGEEVIYLKSLRDLVRDIRDSYDNCAAICRT